MNVHQEDSKRIALNTFLLYVRMFILMLIGLYTSRVILNTLGFNDYGIYNVVGGIVVMFSVFTTTISTAIGRFITYEIGKGDKERLKTVFSTSIYVQIVLAIAIVLLCEIIGYWFLMNKMDIPDNRMDAALWVFHISNIGFGLGLFFTPYTSLIIAHERMGAFAYMSIFDAVAKLLIVYLLLLFDVDKLKLYSVLLFLVGLITSLIYVVYCRFHFEESKIVCRFDKSIFSHMASFAGWNLFGHGAWMLETQGTNLLINMFFGVQLNAARGIAVQVNNLVQQFVGNFMTALTPQITKSFAAGDLEYMRSVVLRGAKFSFFLMFIIALPVALETNLLLHLWLKDYPPYTIWFVRFTLGTSLCMVLVNPLLSALQATGDIRNYQIIVGIVGLMQFPLIYLAFKLGCSPIASYVICLFFYAFFVLFKPWLVRKRIQLPLKTYVKFVIVPIILVSTLSSLFPIIIRFVMMESIWRLAVVCLLSFFCTCFTIWSVGLSVGEKKMVLNVANDRIKRLIKNK